MPPAIKFCGLMRPEDACEAATLGAAYLGVIFAPSPRRVTIEQGASLLAAVDQQLEACASGSARGASAGAMSEARPMPAERERPQRVGVFAHVDTAEIVRTARALSLDVLQLHEPLAEREVDALREATGCRIWSVVRVGAEGVAPDAVHAAQHADGILFDTKVEGELGGTGRTFDWEAAREIVAPLRGTRPVILAGGLHPQNVAAAIATLFPDVVDVSSGVERSAGIKDHARMRAFAAAVRGLNAS